MKLCPAYIAILLMLVSPIAQADGIPGDGMIKAGRGSDPGFSDSCNKTDFKVKLNGHGGLIKNCINTSGVDWIGLDIFAVIPDNQAVTCIIDVPFFSNCVPKSLGGFGNSGKQEVEIELFGGYVITSGSATDNLCGREDP